MQPEPIEDMDFAANEDHAPQSPDKHSSALGRTQVAYYSMLMVHARLMLDTMTRQGIGEFLNGDYTLSLPDDVIADLKGALNAESSDRESFNSRFKTQPD